MIRFGRKAFHRARRAMQRIYRRQWPPYMKASFFYSGKIELVKTWEAPRMSYLLCLNRDPQVGDGITVQPSLRKAGFDLRRTQSTKGRPLRAGT